LKKEDAMARSNYPGNGINTPAARAQREEYWRRAVERWKASGLAKSVFCKREGLSDASLHWWIRQIEARDEAQRRVRAPRPPAPKKAPTTLIPVRVVNSAPPPARKPMEVMVGGHVIRVVPDFDPETFRRLVEVLEGWPTLKEVQPC
jgi:hypothetical protein